MNNNNGSSDLLDRALRDLSAEQRARVLDLVIRLEIDRDDPLWLIAIAIGQLQVLVTDAPEDWRETFVNFQSELITWTNTHLETLEAIAKQALVAKSLAKTSNELNNSTEKLLILLNEHSKNSNNSDRELRYLKNSLTNLQKNMESRFQTVERGTGQNLARIETKISSNGNMMKSLGTWAVCNMALVGIFSILTLSGFVQVSRWQSDNAKKIEWLLEKGNRNDCLRGIKPKNSPECRSVMNK